MAFIPGTLGPDTLTGTNGDDDMYGLGGDDKIYGVNGNDSLFGMDGNDQMYGGAGNDGINGGAGNDYLDGGAGDDFMVGGVGDDGYFVDSALDRVLEEANQGDDIVVAAIDYSLEALGNIESLDLSNIVGAARNAAGNTLNNSIFGNQFDNSLFGLSGDDTLFGDAGNDTLDGGTGNDEMSGGIGNDTYMYSVGDTIVEAVNEGIDTVIVSEDHTLGANLENLTLAVGAVGGIGNELDNVITGNDNGNNLSGLDGDDQLFGLGGNDNLDGGRGNDRMVGGLGNDNYVFTTGDTIVEAANEGIDRVYAEVDYTLGANLEHITLMGSAIRGTGNALNNSIMGTASNNILEGGDGDDRLNGFAGDDSLNGGTGTDFMDGGVGNDTYVYTTGDTIVEAVNAGIDTVLSFSDYTLGDNLENLTLTGTAVKGVGNALNNIITGNASNNTLEGGDGNDELIGLAGDDFLDGGNGVDRMVGGIGNDTYVYVPSDTIVEAANEGTDTVLSSTDYTLAANLENLTLTGAALKGVGNALNNIITGNASNNTLEGAEGNDELIGLAGDDFLDGGVGSDRMVGGTGNDTYVYTAGDTLVEAANEGTDTVFSSTDYTLGANLENLTLTGTALKGTGNELNNIITGNNSNNLLEGGAGIDTLIGGLGDDTYILSDAADVITEAANAGTDTVIASTSYTLGANLENLLMSDASKAKSSSTMTGNDLNNLLVGNAGVNTMSGGAGKDTLISGAGRDVLRGGKGADRFVFSARIQGGDRILDFSKQERDLLVFEAPGFKGLKAGKLKASQFVLGNKALDKSDRFIYDQRRGTLSYDADGLGGAKQTLIATFTTKPTLTAKDFVITATANF